jgi:arginase family enzyme
LSRRSKIVDRGALLASIGGDHSVSFPLTAAFERYTPLTIVMFDAHLDYRDRFLSLEYTNNSPFRRASELLARGHGEGNWCALWLPSRVPPRYYASAG